MSKPQPQLDPALARVSQAELDAAVASIPALEQELAPLDEALTSAIAAKKALAAQLVEAKTDVRLASVSRDAVFEALQQARWIADAADPSTPPPIGNMPDIDTPRGPSHG